MYQLPESPTSAETLFEHIFGEEAQGWLVTFSGQQARLSDPQARHNELIRTEQRYFPYPTETVEAADYLRGEAQNGRDAFFGVHLFRERGNRRSSNTAGMVQGLWLDEDEGDYPEIGPTPTAIVHSSETRRHLYWRLMHPVSVEWAVSMNCRIAGWVGGDTGKAGLASVLRVPKTLNFKRYPKIDPVAGVITGVEPWDPGVMEQAVPPLPEPTSPKAARGQYDGPETDLVDYLQQAGVEVFAAASDEGGTKFSIVCPWVDEHSAGDRSGTYVGQYNSGALWFHCHHEHCHGRGWRDFRRERRPLRVAKVIRTAGDPTRVRKAAIIRDS